MEIYLQISGKKNYLQPMSIHPNKYESRIKTSLDIHSVNNYSRDTLILRIVPKNILQQNKRVSQEKGKHVI